MANEKDIIEKMLFEAEDVFADILNILLFDGKEVIQPHALAPTGQRSQLKIAGIVHEQERAVAKLWMSGRIGLLSWGWRTRRMSKDMIMRVFSYDGASYKEQAVHNRQKGVKKWEPYPAITIVLHFGKTHWNAPRTLKELFGGNIPAELEPYVNDYRVHVFEISFLSPETVAMFKSDFRIVADFFIQTRENEEYEPSAETITHKGLAKGKTEGRLNTLLELVLDGVLPLPEATARANLPEQEFVRKAEEYRRLAGPNQLNQFPQ